MASEVPFKPKLFSDSILYFYPFDDFAVTGFTDKEASSYNCKSAFSPPEMVSQFSETDLDCFLRKTD